MAETITMHEAAQRLGISDTKIWRLVKEGVLPAWKNPLDRREKLIRVADLDRFRNEARQRPNFVSDAIASNPDAVRSDQIEEDLREHWHRSC